MSAALEQALLAAYDAVNRADLESIEAEGSTDVNSLYRAKQTADQLNRDLANIRQRLDSSLGEAMAGYEVVVDGAVLRRHHRKSRTKWNTDDLLRCVLDSRIVDKDTGEVLEESPLDRVLHVWNLPAPRASALKQRGIDVDEFCTTEVKPGWTVEILT